MKSDSINKILEEAKKKFVFRDEGRILDINGDVYIIGKWTKLEQFLLSSFQQIQKEERERVIEEAVARHVCIENCLICKWAEDNGYFEKLSQLEKEENE